VDDASDFNPLNRTNNQENEKNLKLSEIKVLPVSHFSQTMLLPSPAHIHASEQKSQVTLFSPQCTTSNVSPLPVTLTPHRKQSGDSMKPVTISSHPHHRGMHHARGGTNLGKYAIKNNLNKHNQKKQGHTSQKIEPQDLDNNLAIMNFNNYIQNGDLQNPYHTEGEKQNDTDRETHDKFSIVEESQRNQGAKSALILLSQHSKPPPSGSLVHRLPSN
jgi:hypothetical protein